MHAQPTPAISWPEEIQLSSGIFVASGYGLRISVWRGRLRVEDGVGRQRRTVLLHRATSRLKRLVVIGHTGFVSLDAIRWLADINASFVQVDPDGRVLAAVHRLGTDRPRLRRAQARALDSELGLEIARQLVSEKVAGQRAALEALPP
jgi:CRISPR/Cas system-associated endonuclease Cas1